MMRNYFFMFIFTAVLLWSAIAPFDYFTWFLEVLPAIVGLVIIILVRRRFQFTPLVLTLMLIHAIILMVGGHYTYAEVPLFDWIRDAMGHDRNNYDKVGHFVQGFVPAMIIREVFIRKEIVTKSGWLAVIIVSFCLAISAMYELIEWSVAELSGESAEAFLGTQGYVWDTQSDMMLALIGATCAIVLLSKIHDKQLLNLK